MLSQPTASAAGQYTSARSPVGTGVVVAAGAAPEVVTRTGVALALSAASWLVPLPAWRPKAAMLVYASAWPPGATIAVPVAVSGSTAAYEPGVESATTASAEIPATQS